MLRRAAGWAVLAAAFVVLTVLSQIGGIVLLLAAGATRLLRRRFRRIQARLAGFAVFVALYAVLSFVVLPAVAPAFGRVALPCRVQAGGSLAARTPLTCLLNRNYAAPEVRRLLEDLAGHMAAAYPGTVVRYLDANFPLLDGFPLLPHLSHRRGRSVDLAYVYRDETGKPADPPSPIGYWVYEQPAAGDDQPCAGKRSRLRWDLPVLQSLHAGITMDVERTRAMLAWLIERGPAVRYVLLELHVKQRLGLTAESIRFQGCGAARHDDHFHIEAR
jgi:hypothetical protein